jgi:hypothetical protein
MTVVAQDPHVRRDGAILTARITVPAEELGPGPIGYRVQVVDYDSAARCYHGRHELPPDYADEPPAWRRGDETIVTDYRFHAQNVYALVMRTLARFEHALGRRMEWSFRAHQLKVAPHGICDANASYSPDIEGLVFGYFQGRSGAAVHTCLSHDIVVHETAHALIDALRPRYLDPSNPDQAAFHEGLADVVALLSVFSLREVVTHLLLPRRAQGVRNVIAKARVSSDALRQSALFGLADQMGPEVEGLRGSALRTSAALTPDPALKDSAEFQEPHRRGELFVAAVMQAFIRTWAARIRRIGTPGQASYPVAPVSEEGADIADTLLTLWIRAIDYMPPVHLEFGDALSAALTSDHEVRPDESRYELRTHLLEAFAAFGFSPASRRTRPPGVWKPPPAMLRYDRVRFESMRAYKEEVFRFIWDNRKSLAIRPGAYTEVLSVRPCVFIGRDGFTVRETVAEYYQVARLTPGELHARGLDPPAPYLARIRELQRKARAKTRRTARDADSGVTGADAAEPDEPGSVTPVYGGGVLIFDEYGRVKYWVHNDVFGRRQRQRLAYLWDAGLLTPGREGARLVGQRLATLHRARATGASTRPGEGW